MLAKELKDILANVPDDFQITFVSGRTENIVEDSYEIACAYKYELLGDINDDNALVLVGVW